MGTISQTPKSTWETNGRALSILHLNGVTYVAGTFTQVMDHSGNVLARSNQAAFDASGNATTWAPSANGTAVRPCHDGARLYAGGAFTQINGKGHHGVAAIGTDGSVPTWSGKATGGSVQGLALSGSTLYLGGTFTSLNGSARTDLGAVKSADGSLVSWAPAADGRVDALAADSGHVFVGGFFTHINAARRATSRRSAPRPGTRSRGRRTHRPRCSTWTRPEARSTPASAAPAGR